MLIGEAVLWTRRRAASAFRPSDHLSSSTEILHESSSRLDTGDGPSQSVVEHRPNPGLRWSRSGGSVVDLSARPDRSDRRDISRLPAGCGFRHPERLRTVCRVEGDPSRAKAAAYDPGTSIRRFHAAAISKH